VTPPGLIEREYRASVKHRDVFDKLCIPSYVHAREFAEWSASIYVCRYSLVLSRILWSYTRAYNVKCIYVTRVKTSKNIYAQIAQLRARGGEEEEGERGRFINPLRILRAYPSRNFSAPSSPSPPPPTAGQLLLLLLLLLHLLLPHYDLSSCHVCAVFAHVCGRYCTFRSVYVVDTFALLSCCIYSVRVTFYHIPIIAKIIYQGF